MHPILKLFIGVILACGMASAQSVESLALSSSRVVGGSNATGTVSLSEVAPAGGMVVLIESANAIASVPATAVVPAGSRTVSFTIRTSVVGAQAMFTISATGGGVRRAKTLTVIPIPVSGLSTSPGSNTGGFPAVGTVSIEMSAPTGGAVVRLTSSIPSAVSVPDTVTIPAGSTTTTFPVTTSPVATETTSRITAARDGSSITRSFTVRAPVLKTFKLSSLEVYAGRSATGTFILTGPAPAAGLKVDLAISNPLVTGPSSVTVPSGASQAAFTLGAALPSTFSTSVKLTATHPGKSIQVALSILKPGLFNAAPWPRFRGGSRQSGFTPNLKLSSTWEANLGSPVTTTPAVSLDGTVFVGTESGQMFGLSPDDGSVLWSYNVGAKMQSSPVLFRNGNLVFGADDGYLYCLDGNNGSLVWRFQTGGPIVSTPCLGADDRIYFGSNDGGIYAVSRKTGGQVWRYQTTAPVVSSPNLDPNGILVVAGMDSRIYGFDTTASTNRMKWRIIAEGPISTSPAIFGTRAFVTGNKGTMYGIDCTSGAVLWQRNEGDSVVSSPSISPDGSIWITTDARGSGFFFATYSPDGSGGSVDDFSRDECVPRTDLPPMFDNRGGFHYYGRTPFGANIVMPIRAMLPIATHNTVVEWLGNVRDAVVGRNGHVLGVGATVKRKHYYQPWIESTTLTRNWSPWYRSTQAMRLDRANDGVTLTGGLGNGGVSLRPQFTVEAILSFQYDFDHTTNQPYRNYRPNTVMNLWESWSPTNGHASIVVGVDHAGKFYSEAKWGGGTTSGTGSVRAPLLGHIWQHIAWVFDGSTSSLYIDGILRAQTAGNLLPPLGSPQASAIGFNANRPGALMDAVPLDMALLRISSIARYQGPTFDVPFVWDVDSQTQAQFLAGRHFGSSAFVLPGQSSLSAAFTGGTSWFDTYWRDR